MIPWQQYTIPALLVLIGVLSGYILPPIINRFRNKTDQLGDISVRMSEVTDQATQNALHTLELQNTMLVMIQDQKKLQLKYDRLEEKCIKLEEKCNMQEKKLVKFERVLDIER